MTDSGESQSTFLMAQAMPIVIEYPNTTVDQVTAAVRNWAKRGELCAFTLEGGFTQLVNFALIDVLVVSSYRPSAEPPEKPAAKPVVTAYLPAEDLEQGTSQPWSLKD